MRIGELARRAQVGIETIRFYERRGLLADPQRRPSGYRQFDESVVARLAFIRRAKELGFTLTEIAELIALFESDSGCRDHVRDRVNRKIADVESKIESLHTMRRSLEQLLTTCRAHDSIRDCPLISPAAAQAPVPTGEADEPKPAGRRRSEKFPRRG